MTQPPSGEQHELRLGDQRATVVEVGGGVREYTAGHRDVLQGYAVDAMCDGAHGAPLVPWPNRLADGRYTFDGEQYDLPLTEPEKHNAIHGLLRWRNWSASERSESAVTMLCTLRPMKGYPFTVAVGVRYELTEAGLVVTTRAANLGDRACPFGLGQHPYLSTGDGPVDECLLELHAGRRIDTDTERQLPIGTVPVAGTEYDFSTPRRIGDLQVDSAFTDLERDDEGRAWVSCTGRDERTVQVWLGPDYPVVEVYTADQLSGERRRRGLAVEPMTCPPNAFASGEHLLRLEPGESLVRTWGVGLRAD